MRVHAAFALLVGAMVQSVTATADHRAAASVPAADLVEPGDFAASLGGPTAARPLILQVGFRKLYDQARIPGSQYAGPAGQDIGLAALRDRVAGVSKDAPIVIYCGCCPWSRCPNIAAAYDDLHELGFRNVKVLHIAEDFATDWVDKGYPTTRGE